ncbi:MAG: hypothetical protein AABY85_03245 [Gemmatimonadota bacterium]
MSDDTPQARAARRNWQAHIYRLGEGPPGDDLSAVTTPEQRIEMVWELSARMWELTGRATVLADRSSSSGSSARAAWPPPLRWSNVLSRFTYQFIES